MAGPHLSILLRYIKPEKHYLWFGSDLQAESVKLHSIVCARKPTIIIAISPELCALYVYPLKVCVTDRWQQPGWEMGWGFVHGIMQPHISANLRVLWLSKTSHYFPVGTLKDTAPPLCLSLSHAPILFTIIYFAETALHYLLHMLCCVSSEQPISHLQGTDLLSRYIRGMQTQSFYKLIGYKCMLVFLRDREPIFTNAFQPHFHLINLNKTLKMSLCSVFHSKTC